MLYWVKKNKSSDIEKIKEKYNLLGKKYILITMHRKKIQAPNGRKFLEQ